MGTAILVFRVSAQECWRNPLCPSKIILLLLSAPVAEEERHGKRGGGWGGNLQQVCLKRSRLGKKKDLIQWNFFPSGLAAAEVRSWHSGFSHLN